MNPFLLSLPENFPISKEHGRLQVEPIDDHICRSILESDMKEDAKKVFKEHIVDKRDEDGNLNSVLRSAKSHDLPAGRQYSNSTAGLDGTHNESHGRRILWET